MIVVGKVSGRWSMGGLSEAVSRASTYPRSHPHLLPAQTNAEDNQISAAHQAGNNKSRFVYLYIWDYTQF